MSTQINMTTSVGSIPVRGLKHGEVKKLRIRERITDIEQAGNIQDEVLATVLSPDDLAKLDDMYEYEIVEIFRRIMDLTFMSEDLRKNLSWRWDCTMPDTWTVPPADALGNKNS